MSRSHHDRHKWKRKERNRTGKGDPEKIKLHRERFLERLAARHKTRDGYERLVFRARVLYDPDEYTTTVFLGPDELGHVEYLVEDLESLHHFLSADQSIDVGKEEAALNGHALHVRASGAVCHLEVIQDDGFRQCEAAFSCKFRRWNAERSLPECMR
jgi:hypothetical protein